MRTSQPHQRIENRPNRALQWPDLGELCQCRELAAFLALRDLKIRYKQAVFGASWAVPAPRGGRRLHHGLQALRQRAQRGDSPTRCLPSSAWQCGRTRLERAERHSEPRENSHLVTKVYFPTFLALVARSFQGSRTSFFSSCSRCSSPSTTSIRRGHRHAAGMAARHGRDRGHRAVAWNFERKGLSLENLLHGACARTV
jgi:hypothetical protein